MNRSAALIENAATATIKTQVISFVSGGVCLFFILITFCFLNNFLFFVKLFCFCVVVASSFQLLALCFVLCALCYLRHLRRAIACCIF